MLRCKDCLDNSLDLSSKERKRILLAQVDLGKLIVQVCHIRSLPSGVRSTLVLLRNQFWLPNFENLFLISFKSVYHAKKFLQNLEIIQILRLYQPIESKLVTLSLQLVLVTQVTAC